MVALSFVFWLVLSSYDAMFGAPYLEIMMQPTSWYQIVNLRLVYWFTLILRCEVFLPPSSLLSSRSSDFQRGVFACAVMADGGIAVADRWSIAESHSQHNNNTQYNIIKPTTPINNTKSINLKSTEDEEPCARILFSTYPTKYCTTYSPSSQTRLASLVHLYAGIFVNFPPSGETVWIQSDVISGRWLPVI